MHRFGGTQEGQGEAHSRQHAGLRHRAERRGGVVAGDGTKRGVRLRLNKEKLGTLKQGLGALIGVRTHRRQNRGV